MTVTASLGKCISDFLLLLCGAPRDQGTLPQSSCHILFPPDALGAKPGTLSMRQAGEGGAEWGWGERHSPGPHIHLDDHHQHLDTQGLTWWTQYPPLGCHCLEVLPDTLVTPLWARPPLTLGSCQLSPSWCLSSFRSIGLGCSVFAVVGGVCGQRPPPSPRGPPGLSQQRQAQSPGPGGCEDQEQGPQGN